MIPVAMMIQAARGRAKNWDSIPKDMMGLPMHIQAVRMVGNVSFSIYGMI